MTKTEWLSLEKKMRFRAFTMAKLGEVNVIETVKNQLVKAMESGEGFAASFDTVKEIAKASGKTLTPFYWETVFRTNVQGAYVAGKLLQYQKFPPAAYRLLVIEDVRTSDICRHLLTQSGYGVTLPVDHPFWTTHGFPPYHMNCRTGISAVYNHDVEVTAEVSNGDGVEIGKEFKVQDEFGGNPIEKESWWKLTPSMIKRADKYGITADIVALARGLDMQSYFPELLKGYEPVYQSATGGYVQKAVNWKYSEHEMSVSERLANDGHKIYLLPRTDNAKSPDMLIDDEIGEIKILEGNSYKTLIKRVAESSKKQRARILYLKAINDMELPKIKEAIKKGAEGHPLKTVFIDFRGGFYPFLLK